MIGFLIKYRYFVLSGTIALALIIGWSIVKGRIYDQGYAACETAHQEAKHKADEETRARQKEIKRKDGPVKNENKKKQGYNDPANSFLRDAFRRLRANN